MGDIPLESALASEEREEEFNYPRLPRIVEEFGYEEFYSKFTIEHLEKAKEVFKKFYETMELNPDIKSLNVNYPVLEFAAYIDLFDRIASKFEPANIDNLKMVVNPDILTSFEQQLSTDNLPYRHNTFDRTLLVSDMELLRTNFIADIEKFKLVSIDLKNKARTYSDIADSFGKNTYATVYFRIWIKAVRRLASSLNDNIVVKLFVFDKFRKFV